MGIRTLTDSQQLSTGGANVDLRGIANAASDTVNPNIIVSVLASTGSTISSTTARQVPAYADPVTGPAQLQALDGSELRQLDGMNLQGVLRSIYLRGLLAGAIRADSKGGDLITIAAQTNVPAPFVGTWLIVKIFESWPLWTKAAINFQGPA